MLLEFWALAVLSAAHKANLNWGIHSRHCKALHKRSFSCQQTTQGLFVQLNCLGHSGGTSCQRLASAFGCLRCPYCSTGRVWLGNFLACCGLAGLECLQLSPAECPGKKRYVNLRVEGIKLSAMKMHVIMKCHGSSRELGSCLAIINETRPSWQGG